MKKIIFLLLIHCSINNAFSQEKITTKNGKIVFEGTIASFEEVKATNDGVTAVLNLKTGEFASLALIKGFHFKVALMEEHFNENYVNSTKYPKAIYRGKITNFNSNELTTEFKEYTIQGKLELNGATNNLNTILKIRKTDKGIEIKSNCYVQASDYNISIPSAVKSKVSNKINIKGDFSFTTK
jgi:hypothetical protein